eukprot:5983785-Ditylum_brightwellii.AAC.1
MGAFPKVSNKGVRYVMVFYVYDTIYIKGIPIKNRITEEFQPEYEEMYSELTSKGFKPKMHKLNNKASCNLMEWIKKEQGTQVELRPPGMCRLHLSEKVIQTQKGHFISGVAGLPDKFPIIILNLLQLCQQNPALYTKAATSI